MHQPECLHKFVFEPIQSQNVLKGLLRLDGDSYCDILDIDEKLLKHGAYVIAPLLTHLFNISVVSQFIPLDWKLARVTPIYKRKGDVNDAGNE